MRPQAKQLKLSRPRRPVQSKTARRLSPCPKKSNVVSMKAEPLMLVIGETGPVWRWQQAHVLDGDVEPPVRVSVGQGDGLSLFHRVLVERELLRSVEASAAETRVGPEERELVVH